MKYSPRKGIYSWYGIENVGTMKPGGPWISILIGVSSRGGQRLSPVAWEMLGHYRCSGLLPDADSKAFSPGVGLMSQV